MFFMSAATTPTRQHSASASAGATGVEEPAVDTGFRGG
jgi:hypothetical protein